MVDWVALCQAAKKGLRHSPYVTCFTSASAMCICYQSAPVEGLGVLNSNCLSTPPFLSFLPVSLFSFYPPPCACVTCHMDVIADKRTLMHVESMADQHARTHTNTHTHAHTCMAAGTHKQNSHPLICQWRCYTFTQSCFRVCLRTLFLREEDWRNIVFHVTDRPWQ